MKKIIQLNNDWKMQIDGFDGEFDCSVPCSVYQTLFENKAVGDPYYRENEYDLTRVCDGGCRLEKRFAAGIDVMREKRVFLTFEGIDTLGEIYLNGMLLGLTNNMHCSWEFDIRELLKIGENIITVKLLSPNRYIAEKQSKRRLWGVDSTMEGYSHIRKAHYMFGWDWGPKLPDMGIFRPVYLTAYSSGRILDVQYLQTHENSAADISCIVHCDPGECNGSELKVYDPQGELCACAAGAMMGEYFDISCHIEKPQLWWVNGMGGQPLYRCEVTLFKDETAVDSDVKNIGLRSLTVSQEKDEWGEEFCFKLNGKKIFAMGGNYIPEDQLLSRRSRERTERLLEDCKKANFNFIRVWGGGIYPDDWFYDCCDRLGLIVWQDFMFACSAYLLTEEFENAVRREVEQNVIRLRDHPSLGMWCGNNEIESAWAGWGIPQDEQSKADYLRQFEQIIPEIVKSYSPQIFYWCSSPSSGGGFKDPSSNKAGDMHYWAVWHNLRPIEDFRQYYYRFCSEYGFESLPSIKTVRTFADEDKGDLDLMSPVMETHQKCTQGNEKLMFYLAQMVRYPYSFERLIYSSQLLQADCIRSSVEHMRRARGRCMGSAYWQINDSNPVISWSGIDYFNRWKALHYYAARFYAPVLISCDDSDISAPQLYVTNDTLERLECRYEWRLRDSGADILREGGGSLISEPLTSVSVQKCGLDGLLDSRSKKRRRYLEFVLYCEGREVSRGSTLFVRPKEFDFHEPRITVSGADVGGGFSLTLCAENFAKSVCLDMSEGDCLFSDNWFDIHGAEPVTVFVDRNSLDGVDKNISLEDFFALLTVQSNYEKDPEPVTIK